MDRLGLGLVIGLIVVLIGVGRMHRLVARDRRRIAHRAWHEPADAVAERGDVTRKSWPAAFGGAPTEHAKKIDHPRLLAFYGDPARCSRDLPRRPLDPPTQHE